MNPNKKTYLTLKDRIAIYNIENPSYLERLSELRLLRETELIKSDYRYIYPDEVDFDDLYFDGLL